MLTRISLLTAVCFATTAGLLVSSLPAADEVTKTTTVTPTNGSMANVPGAMDFTLPAGITPQNLNDDKSIEKAFKGVTEYALSQNGFGDIVDYLVDQDRTNIKNSLGKASYSNVDANKNKHLNDLAFSLSNTYKGKYNQKFDIDIAKAYPGDFAQILTGEVADANQLVGKWPLDASMASGLNGKITPADAATANKKYFGGDVNLEKGRKVAVAHIAASHGLPDLTVSMIHEAGGWKFDVPKNLTAQRLYDDLVANLNYVDQHKDQLPADVNDGYREMTHAVVAALYDVNLSDNTGNMVRPGGNAVMDH